MQKIKAFFVARIRANIDARIKVAIDEYDRKLNRDLGTRLRSWQEKN